MAVMFQQRHYEALARTIYPMPRGYDKSELVYSLSRMFSQDNPHFKPLKFREACGL